MTLEQLFALGAASIGGNIDLKGKNIGRLLANGEVLISPEGEEVLADLKPAVDVEPAAPVAKAKRSKKAAEPAVETPPPADDDGGLGDLLSDME